MALRGQIEDRDYDSVLMWQLLDGMKMVASAQPGVKVKDIPKPQPTIRDEPDADEIYVEDILKMHGGNGGVIDYG